MLLCYNTYATHLNMAQSRGILLVKMYSLSLTLCRCVAALREAFFGASFVAHFFIFRGKTLKRIIAVLLALSSLSACSSNAAESYVPQGTSSPSYQYTSQEETYSQTVSHNEAHNYESSTKWCGFQLMAA